MMTFYRKSFNVRDDMSNSKVLYRERKKKHPHGINANGSFTIVNRSRLRTKIPKTKQCKLNEREIKCFARTLISYSFQRWFHFFFVIYFKSMRWMHEKLRQRFYLYAISPDSNTNREIQQIFWCYLSNDDVGGHELEHQSLMTNKEFIK